jgi:N-acetylglucosamine kinase-like BadF-type ATPase
MAILIADSGSTKTDWICLTGDDESTQIEVQTVGLNPFHVSDNEIRGVLTHDVLPQLGDSNVEAVYFYGSGVRSEVEGRVEGLLRESFPDAKTVQAHSDLLGACRALCGDEAGIACILGTGANSCVYDGKKIVHNTPALGYILGDEGSGAVLGKHLLHDLYTGVLPHNLRLTFEREMGLELSEIINKVYREPQANRFLASLSEFIHRHLDEEGIRQMVYNTFSDFINYHVSRYGRHDLPLSFVGSIAFYYQEQLQLIVQMLGYPMGTILKSPLQGLVAYHSK